MPNSIYWTLQNNCPQEWESKFNLLNYSIQHIPLIELALNESYSTILESVDKFDVLIVSSQFSAQKISNIFENKKLVFYTVGLKASAILKDAGHKVLHTSEDSECLAEYLKDKVNIKILHLCSEKSRLDIWPPNVKTLPFYKPIQNTNFKLLDAHVNDNSIIAFGSPSAVDIWFSKNLDLSTTTIATIGKTTANRFENHTKRHLIIPQSSTIDHLCEAIYNYLKLPEYEQTK